VANGFPCIGSCSNPVSPNKSLQRSVNHKVLGRGREVSAPWRAPARPRADKSARGR
jgi:hypothetical protein